MNLTEPVQDSDDVPAEQVAEAPQHIVATADEDDAPGELAGEFAADDDEDQATGEN